MGEVIDPPVQALALVAFVFIAKRFRYRTLHTDSLCDGATLEQGADAGMGPGAYTVGLAGSK